MDNDKITPHLNLNIEHLKQSHAFNCPSRDTSDNIVIKKHVNIRDAILIFCADCGNPLDTISCNNRVDF